MPIGAALTWDDDHCYVMIVSSGEGTYLVRRIRGGKRKRRQARVGAPDAALTPSSGLAGVSELCDRLGVIEALDAAVGPVKQRKRGFGAGELLAGIASAQLAGEDFLVGLDRQREDAAGQQITPVPGAELDDRGGPGPPDHRRAVAVGGDGAGGGHGADAGPAARGAGGGAGRGPGHD
jgi:hypothetical protein